METSGNGVRTGTIHCPAECRLIRPGLPVLFNLTRRSCAVVLTTIPTHPADPRRGYFVPPTNPIPTSASASCSTLGCKDRQSCGSKVGRKSPCRISAICETHRMYNKENLTKIKKMNELAPEVMKAFWAFDKAAVADGAIPVKYKELIAVAVALTTQCPYCIDIHSGNARKAGATDAEMVEAAMVAASLRAGAAVTHATHALPN